MYTPLTFISHVTPAYYTLMLPNLLFLPTNRQFQVQPIRVQNKTSKTGMPLLPKPLFVWTEIFHCSAPSSFMRPARVSRGSSRLFQDILLTPSRTHSQALNVWIIQNFFPACTSSTSRAASDKTLQIGCVPFPQQLCQQMFSCTSDADYRNTAH